VHAAEGYARSTGKVGVVLVTSGPGATNAVTGLTDALMDSIPVVCITGQVPTHLIGNDAFQECDTVGITRPCTKHNYLVKRIEDLPRVLHEAFYVAKSGRPGPVVVDIPKDIQFAKGDYFKPKDFPHQGYIESFDNRLDPNTGSILVRAVFDNANDRIVPGLFAHIRIPLSERHSALLVDDRAIGTDQAQKFVLTVTATNTVAYRQVQLGPLAEGKRIVRSGLDAGEKIVVNGLQRVRPGMPVTPETEVAAKPAAQKLAQR